MNETLTNPENVTALVGHRDAITTDAQVAAPLAAGVLAFVCLAPVEARRRK